METLRFWSSSSPMICLQSTVTNGFLCDCHFPKGLRIIHRGLLGVIPDKQGKVALIVVFVYTDKLLLYICWLESFCLQLDWLLDFHCLTGWKVECQCIKIWPTFEVKWSSLLFMWGAALSVYIEKPLFNFSIVDVNIEDGEMESYGLLEGCKKSYCFASKVLLCL